MQGTEKITNEKTLCIFFLKGSEIYCDMAVYLILYSSCFLLGVLDNDIPVIRIFFPLFSFSFFCYKMYSKKTSLGKKKVPAFHLFVILWSALKPKK